jgi:hypothetical protein
LPFFNGVEREVLFLFGACSVLGNDLWNLPRSFSPGSLGDKAALDGFFHEVLVGLLEKLLASCALMGAATVEGFVVVDLFGVTNDLKALGLGLGVWE